jgi:hypothetical protein
MSTHEPSGEAPAAGRREGEPKKAYLKPAFRLERVFETTALACGKIDNTQSACRTNRRNS